MWKIVKALVNYVEPIIGLHVDTVQVWDRRCEHAAFAYGVVGAQRVEGVGPTHKQASLSAEEHLHEVTAFILQKESGVKWGRAWYAEQLEMTGKKKRQSD